MEALAPLAVDGKPGCPVVVWDGPYHYRCSLGAAVGRCAYHGPFATPPAVTQAEVPTGDADQGGGKG